MVKLGKSWCAIALAPLLVAGCAEGRGGSIPYDVTLPPPDRPSIAPLSESYRIAPMDTLSVKVFRVPDLSGDYEVDLTGQISLPLIGAVPAADLTTAQLDQKLTQQLGEKYLENPDISVGVKASTRQSVTVDGAVKQGGSFPVGAGSTTLMQAVAMSGGAAEDANLHRVAIFRTIGGKRQAAAFDLAAIRRGEADDPTVYPGDIIIVDGSKIKALQKQILQNIPLLAIFGPV